MSPVTIEQTAQVNRLSEKVSRLGSLECRRALKMRILFLTAKFPPVPCGIGYHTQRLSSELIKHGHDVFVLTTASEATVDTPPIQSINVFRAVKKWDFTAKEIILSTICENKIDLLHIQYHAAAFQWHPMITMLPLLIKKDPRGKKLKIVVTLHELAGPLKGYLPRTSRRVFLIPLTFSSDALIVTNERDRSHLKWMPYLKRKLHLVPLASNITPTPHDPLNTKRIRSELGVSEKEILLVRFGFVNNLGDTLIKELLETVDRLVRDGYNVKLLLLGAEEEPYKERILSYAKKLKIDARLIFTGYCDPTNVSRYLQSADIAVQLYPEGVCERRSALQAVMAHGLPIISNRNGPLPSMFEHEKNVMISSQNAAEQIATCVEEVINNGKLKSELGENAAATARQFTWPEIGEKTSTLFESLLT